MLDLAEGTTANLLPLPRVLEVLPLDSRSARSTVLLHFMAPSLGTHRRSTLLTLLCIVSAIPGGTTVTCRTAASRVRIANRSRCQTSWSWRDRCRCCLRRDRCRCCLRRDRCRCCLGRDRCRGARRQENAGGITGDFAITTVALIAHCTASRV